jgi:CRP/FNR family transcriptional regulator, LitR-dependent transcriptional activator
MNLSSNPELCFRVVNFSNNLEYVVSKYADLLQKGPIMISNHLSETLANNGPVAQDAIRFNRGQMIYSQGSPTKAVYRIETGLLRLVKVTPKGRVITVRHLLPGDYFGEEALDHEYYCYGVEALTRTLVTPLELDVLQSEEADSSGILVMLKNIGEQLRRAMQYSYNLQAGELKQRVVRYLLELADTPLGGEDGDNFLFVKATHELIAEGTASTRESVSKVITELREAGLIESGYRQITLKCSKGLHQLLTPARGEDTV